MQNLIVGKSGSGKGYEVCAFHIMVALTQGRKVITNMPLNLKKWAAIDPSFPALIEMRKRAMPIRGTWEPTREEGAFHLFDDPLMILQPPVTARPFAGVWDYFDTWRHPETGVGALFVIDEAQNVIPRAKTCVEVEEWSALHRHFVSDVLFMTQSYGKLSQAIRDNIQMVYRLTKKVAWGQPNKYIRKVQDGIRGEVLNVTERTYNPAFFGLWKSQTQGDSGQEYGANDLVPFWKHWTFKGTAICFAIAGLIACYAIFGGDRNEPVKVRLPAAAPAPTPQVSQIATETAEPRGTDQKLHPYQGFTMHLAALMTGKRVRDGVEESYLNGYVTIAQNGQPVSKVSFLELRSAGYSIKLHSYKVISLTFKDVDVGYVVDDLPQVSLAPEKTLSAK